MALALLRLPDLFPNVLEKAVELLVGHAGRRDRLGEGGADFLKAMVYVKPCPD
jgi:hypothetical protein